VYEDSTGRGCEVAKSAGKPATAGRTSLDMKNEESGGRMRMVGRIR
jgi:hypothetical protein